MIMIIIIIIIINCRVVAVVRYAAGIVEWTKKELQIMDGRSTSKMCLQSVECVKKGMGQLAVLYRNARNLFKSNIDVGDTTRWRG